MSELHKALEVVKVSKAFHTSSALDRKSTRLNSSH